MRLLGEPDAVPRARRLVARTLAAGEFATLAPDVELVVSELVTNALLHGAPPIDVRVSVQPGPTARVEVADTSRQAPVRVRAGAEAMTGRGLALVEALVSQWGVEARPDGKVVWATVRASGGDEPGRDRPRGDTDATEVIDIDELLAAWADLQDTAPEPRYTVLLGDVPTDLLLAAKAHVDNLVREFTLAASGAASGATAKMPAPLARLVEAVTTRFSEARQAIKRQALAASAAGEERTRLVLTLPASAAAAGEEYVAALDEADAYARAARLLTLETPPAHRAFRRWYVSGLVDQLRRAAAGESPVPALTFERYLLGELSTVAAAHQASRRAARLQAVTASLAGVTNAEDIAEVVVSEVVDVMRASGGSLLVPLGDEHIGVPGAVGYPEQLVEQLRAERLDAELPAAEVLRTGRPVWLESRQERDERYPELIGFEPSTVSMCAVPLAVQGRVLGALRLSFDAQRLFDTDERAFVLALAAQTAQALERVRLFTAERDARRRAAFLGSATELLTSSLDPQQTVEHLTSLLVPRLADWAVVHLRDEAGRIDPTAFAHADPVCAARLRPHLLRDHVLRGDPSGVDEAVRTGRSLRSAPVPAYLTARVLAGLDPADADAVRPQAAMVVPLVTRGMSLGAVSLVRTDATPYDDDELMLVEDVVARAAVAVLNAQQYERERETAVTLQRSLLPQRVPEIAGVRFAWRYLPAGVSSHVGGDWYDVLELEDGLVALVIGDVMGRGVQAAALMGQLRATARAHATARGRPAEVLAQLDRALARLEQTQITTAAFALLDPAARSLTLATAGHLPPLLLGPEGGASYVEIEPGPPLGAGAEDCPETTVQLPPGAMLLLYTDGLVEDRSRPVDEGMRTLRTAAAGASDPEQLCDIALAAMDRADRRDDDTALLAVRLVSG